jgi:peptidylprolyl isomerase
MKKGDMRRLIIPYNLAYGERGRPPQIPARADLVFDVELVGFSEPVGDMTIHEGYDTLTTESGVKYFDIKEGEGEAIQTGQNALVHYSGWLLDGSKFDSSRDRGQPFQFRIGANQVIKGWDQGVVGMKKGGIRQLIIPFELAYGETGRPPRIPPKSTLVFEIELLEFEGDPSSGQGG